MTGNLGLANAAGLPQESGAIVPQEHGAAPEEGHGEAFDLGEVLSHHILNSREYELRASPSTFLNGTRFNWADSRLTFRQPSTRR